MAWPTFRFPLLECGAFVGVLFGCWLIQQTFQPASDLPNRALLALAAFDLLVCFSVLGYRLRRRLQAGKGLPRYWIVTGAVSLACYLGCITALLLDANRVANELQKATSLHGDIAARGNDLANTYRARWHAVGATALTGVVLILGALLMWTVFDRELRRVWKRQARLAQDEARFRALVEQHSDALALLDTAGNIAYVNPVWQTAFGYEADDLLGRNWYDLIHADDRVRVRTSPVQMPITCRLSADYGIWHDVELLHQPPADDGTTIMRVRDLRETAEMPKPPSVDPRLEHQQDRIAELEREIARLRVREAAQKAEIVVHLREKSSHAV